MTFRKGTFSRLFFYCSYAVLLTGLLLYVRFPGDRFKAYCTRQVEALFEGTACRIGRLSYAFPIGLTLEEVEFSLTGTKGLPLIVLDSITLSPMLANPGRVFRLQGKTYSGQFCSTLHIKRNDKRFSLEAISIEHLNLSKMKSIHDVLGRNIKGLLDFSGSCSAVVNQYLGGKVQGKVKITNGEIALVQPVMALKTINLQEVEGEIEYDLQKLQILNGKMKGRELSADFTYTMHMVSPWYTSGVALAGNVAPRAAFLKDSQPLRNEIRALQKQYKKPTIPFRVGGSLQKPTFQFGR